jgi:hypothetical protein
MPKKYSSEEEHREIRKMLAYKNALQKETKGKMLKAQRRLEESEMARLSGKHIAPKMGDIEKTLGMDTAIGRAYGVSPQHTKPGATIQMKRAFGDMAMLSRQAPAYAGQFAGYYDIPVGGAKPAIVTYEQYRAKTRGAL